MPSQWLDAGGFAGRREALGRGRGGVRGRRVGTGWREYMGHELGWNRRGWKDGQVVRGGLAEEGWAVHTWTGTVGEGEEEEDEGEREVRTRNGRLSL